MLISECSSNVFLKNYLSFCVYLSYKKIVLKFNLRGPQQENQLSLSFSFLVFIIGQVMPFFCWSFLLTISINLFLSMISCLSDFFSFPILYKSTELKLGFRSVTLFKFSFFSFASKLFSDVYLFRFSWIYVNNICKPIWIIPPARNVARAELLELQNLHDYPIRRIHFHLLQIPDRILRLNDLH